ncbi:TfuA-like protein [Streptomyces sp. NPDC046909]|uniref:TfuA-like protein n=1 Tax=Streptomyces sp. NPDC046909 TaxID=3155617 RepID=UPI0034083E1E
MWPIDTARPIVFGGASVRPLDPALPAAVELRPPVRRGDLTPLLDRRPGTVVIIDGLFGGSLAVTPTECRELLDAGWTLVGASSMGALRAADLWPLGAIGVGDVFTLYRLGALTSDADVATTLDADAGFAELTVSVVHLRAVLAAAVASGVLAPALRTAMSRAAEDVHWTERSWPACRAAWRELGVSEPLVSAVLRLGRETSLHPKVRDADTTLRSVLANDWIGDRIHPVRRCPACQELLEGALFCPTCVSEAHETCL